MFSYTPGWMLTKRPFSKSKRKIKIIMTEKISYIFQKNFFLDPGMDADQA